MRISDWSSDVCSSDLLISCPDLAQTVIVCCAALGYETSFTGLETLKIKETDRILALQNELAKFGVRLYEAEKETYRIDCSKRFNPDTITIKTYEDHRMEIGRASCRERVCQYV